MGACWETIFHPNQSPQFINENTRRVNMWYREIKPSLQHKQTIDFTTLDPNHPILRPITSHELTQVIKNTKNKTPGPDNIKLIQLKSLPENYIHAIVDLHNSTIASHYYPKQSKDTKMIFIHKPNKDHKHPFSYRPISLLNTKVNYLKNSLHNKHFFSLNTIIFYLNFSLVLGRVGQPKSQSIC